MNKSRKGFTFQYGKPSVLLLALIGMLFVGQPAWSQQSDRGLTPMEVSKVKSVGDAIVSPDGNPIAYTLSNPADPAKNNGRAENHLYILDLHSGDSRPYVTTMSVGDIHFRPEHKTITFLGRRKDDKTRALYEIPLRGGEAQKLYSFKGSISSYSWAPDGKYIAFMAADPEMSGEATSVLPYKPEVYEENLRQQRGYVANVNKPSQGPHQLQVKGSVYQMEWDPKGERIAIAVAPTPLVDDFYMSQQVKIVDRHGENVLAEIDHEGKLGDIGWSPDGNYLAMLAGADIHDPIAGRLFVVSADGGGPTNLKPDFDGMFEQFSWKDNNTLNYLASKSVWSTFGSIGKDGSDMKTIIKKGKPILHEFSLGGNGTAAFVADSPTHPTEVYVKKNARSSIKRMTNSNPWLTDVAKGKQEVVSWEARDGKILEGILIYPLNYDQSKSYPLITVVHGGPESHYDNGWLTDYNDAGQLGSANGYFVFYPNYRGSTGRGQKFAKSSQDDLAGAEFDDIVDGIDELISSGAVDSKKVGVTGGSYGGYATGWMSTKYTDRFAAGVMFVGISDNISKWGTSDIPEELYLVHARKRIWEDYRGFLERSPIYHAGEAKTPLLIMAGKEDTRVDPGQSYELYRHIKTRTDTPVRLVLYPGEGHGNARATAQLDYTLRMMRWFNEYLKGGGEQPSADIGKEEVEVKN